MWRWRSLPLLSFGTRVKEWMIRGEGGIRTHPASMGRYAVRPAQQEVPPQPILTPDSAVAQVKGAHHRAHQP
jgi:hypothetical protein